MLFNLSLLGCSSYITGVIIDDTGSQSMTMTWNEVYALGILPYDTYNKPSPIKHSQWIYHQGCHLRYPSRFLTGAEIL